MVDVGALHAIGMPCADWFDGQWYQWFI